MKYIDAEKLIEWLEEMKRAEYENCGGVNSKTGALQEVQDFIDSLQQEQQEVDLDEEIDRFLKSEESTTYENAGSYKVATKDLKKIARHFYELGLKEKKAISAEELDKLVNEEFASHNSVDGYGCLSAIYNRTELYNLIKRILRLSNAINND